MAASRTQNDAGEQGTEQTPETAAKQETPSGAVRMSKGEAVRFAYTPSDVVAAEWDGFTADDAEAKDKLLTKAQQAAKK